MEAEFFERMVTVLQHYITVYIYSAQRIDESVIAPTKMLSLLRKLWSHCYVVYEFAVW